MFGKSVLVPMTIPSGVFLSQAIESFNIDPVHSKNVAGRLSTCICCGRNLVSLSVQRQNLSFISTRTETWDVFLFKYARLILYQVPVGTLLANKGLREPMHPCSVLSAPCAAKVEAAQSHLHLKPPHQHRRIE